VKKVRSHNNKKEYLVEWEGISIETWEPFNSIPKEIIQQFTTTKDLQKKISVSFEHFEEIVGNKTKTKTIQEIINSRKITFEKFGDKTKLLMVPREKSWIHSFWIEESELRSIPEIQGHLESFLSRHLEPQFLQSYVNDYCQIERIIHSKDSLYFVKWKSLEYDQSTWETKSDISNLVNFNQIEKEMKLRNQPKEENKSKPFSEFYELKESPVFKNDLEMRGYQVEGVNWLLSSYFEKCSSILADEMGLGKTVNIT
jgi:SNF2 family DNA or RNA helicase